MPPKSTRPLAAIQQDVSPSPVPLSDPGPWSHDANAQAIETLIQARHVRASAALPFLFPAVLVDGRYYVDGGLRMSTPLSPALEPAARDRLEARLSRSGGGSDGDDPERLTARRELARLLERSIDALPEPFRVVYVLREVEGMSTQETAESLALEVNTVKTRLHRARSLLRDRLYGNVDRAVLEAFPFGAERCDRVVAAVLHRLARGIESIGP